MKELSIEEKAKRYDEAKARISKAYNNNRCTFGFMNEIFPELAESEDDRIKKRIIQAIKLREKDMNEEWSNEIAWLEKQGEQKPMDKIEPKFKVGDWIITNKSHIWYVDETPETTSYLYRLINQYGKVEVAEFEVVDKKARLWTIQDAKDGDVLACKNDIVIFKENNYNPKDESGCMFVYCSCNNFYEIGGINPTDYKPATKEQRELLFQKMVEYGYVWDAEKKELKKIEQNPADEIGNYDHKEVIQTIINEQKPAWSEEDENIRLRLIDYLYGKSRLAKDREDGISWLKFLKDRVQPQSQWKPTKEQMDALRFVKKAKILDPDEIESLDNLYRQLKKLK